MASTWKQRASPLLWCAAEQHVSGTVRKGKILTPHRKARKWRGEKEEGKERNGEGEGQTEYSGKGEEKPHPSRSKKKKREPHGDSRCPLGWEEAGGANWLGSRGLGRGPACISGAPELLTIYNSVLSKWIATWLDTRQEAEV